MKKTVTIALAAGCILASAAQWDFKDGENSKIVREKDNSALNGNINNPALCSWAREDDRGWFLTFKNGGSVIVPHADSLNFEKGFTARIHFSYDISGIGRTNFSNLFTKGANFQQGYSIMIGRGGTLLLNLRGFKPEYYIAKLGMESNVEYFLSIYAGDGKVRIFLNGKEAASYPVTGTLQLKDNLKPLYVGSLGLGYGFSGNIYSFSITPYTPPTDEKRNAEKVKFFIPLPIADPPGTVIVNDFSKFRPSENILVSSAVSASSERKWILRHVAFMAQSDSVLHPPLSPDSILTFDPGLKGNYDVYASLRAVDADTALQFNLSNSDTWYKLETTSVGGNHRNVEMRIARNVKMDGVQVRLASSAAFAYLGNIKFVPAGNKKEWMTDPVGKVTAGSKMTEATLNEFRKKEIKDKIASGYFKELHYVEKRSASPPSAQSIKRGYVLFEQPWMELLFKNSVPAADKGEIELKTSLAPGEFEPVTLGVRATRPLKGVTLRMGKPFSNGIQTEIAVVESIPKRTSNYCSASEFINAPQYLEQNGPVDIAPGQTRQFWITLHAPENVKPGNGHAELELVNGDSIERIPVTAHVYDLKLRPVEGYDIGFWVSFGDQDKDAIDRQIRCMIDHGMTSFVAGNFFTIKGNKQENYSIDFPGSTATIIGEACRKYNLRGNMIVAVDTLNKGDAFTRLVKEFDDYADKHRWPKRIYTVNDEVPSHPQIFPAFTKSIKALHEAGFKVMADHIWYKTSRPLQKEVDQATPYIDVFVERFNTRRLFYVDTWEEMEAEALKRGKKLYAYNSNNALTFAQPAAMRFAGGWFFRSLAKQTTGHLIYAFNASTSHPYTDLDGVTTDWLYVYPQHGSRKGGPAIDFEAFREGVDDLRYILTLEHEIAAARKAGFTAQANTAENVLKQLMDSFDKKSFYEKSVFFDSKWSERQVGKDGKIYVSGELNIPNGWTFETYGRAREKIADEIMKLQKLNRN